jgi:hypothetical protein
MRRDHRSISPFLVTILAVTLFGQTAFAEPPGWVIQHHLTLGPAAESAAMNAASPDFAARAAEEGFTKQRPAFHRVTVKKQQRLTGRMPRHRNPELSTDQLVVAAVDARGKEITRLIVPDPRLIRAEEFDEASGEIVSSAILYRESAEFSVTLPDDQRIKSIRLYQPTWTGKAYSLEPIGDTQLP